MNAVNISNASVTGTIDNISFEPYESVVEVDPLREIEKFLKVPWVLKFYWRSEELVNQYSEYGNYAW